MKYSKWNRHYVQKLTSNSQSASLTRTKMPGLLEKQDKLFKSSCSFRCCQRIVLCVENLQIPYPPSITGSWRYKRETNAKRARNEHETMSERKPAAISPDHSLRKTVTRKNENFKMDVSPISFNRLADTIRVVEPIELAYRIDTTATFAADFTMLARIM